MSPYNRLAYQIVYPPFADPHFEKIAQEKMNYQLGQKLMVELKPDQWYTIRLRQRLDRNYEYGPPQVCLYAQIDLNLSREERVTIFKYEDLPWWELSLSAMQEIRRRIGLWLKTRWPKTIAALKAMDPT